MKWYFALNEAGTRGSIGLHAKLAVLSARNNTLLQPHLLYTGGRNEFTRWMEALDVTVIDSAVPYLSVIEALVAEGRYSTATLGHWLRTNTCLVEREETYVLYTDVDVLFLREPELAPVRPEFFAASPQFHPDEWNYFNAGVMVQNVLRLRSTYDDFERYLVTELRDKTYGFHDQIAYNHFYRGVWDRLAVECNWKPYWGVNHAASIIHFHGPKVRAIAAIAEGKWNWATRHGSQIGSLFASHVSDYAHHMRLCLSAAHGLRAADADFIARTINHVEAFSGPPEGIAVDLTFTSHRMFRSD